MKRVDGELAVSRALGDFQFKDAGRAPEATKVTSLPDVSVHARDDRDQFLVLACDGIWDVMSNEVKHCALLCVVRGHANIGLLASLCVGGGQR